MITADILDHQDLAHGFFTRNGGVSTGVYESLNIGYGSKDNHDHVTENRQRCAQSLGTSLDRLATPHQIHSASVISLSAPWQESQTREADALVTNTPNLAIGIATADCGPLLFADIKNRVIGAAHAGWKGAFGGIIENTVLAMEMIGAERDSIICVLGPTISKSAYEVGPEFYDRFQKQSATNDVFFAPSQKQGHHMFDLPAYILSKMTEAGISQAKNLEQCTYGLPDRFFSYRRNTHQKEADYGRLLSAIMLK